MLPIQFPQEEKKNRMSTSTCTLLISALTLLISSVISHPFFFLSLILLFSYLLKLLSFLSPLFITTSLLLTAFLTISATESSKGTVSFLYSAYQAVLLKLRPKTQDEDVQSPETLQVYRTVFEPPLIHGLEENPEEKILQAVESSVVKKIESRDGDGSVKIHEDLTSELESASEPESYIESESDSGNSEKLETIKSEMQGKRISGFLKETCEMESRDFSVEEKKVEPADTNVDKAVDQETKESAAEAAVGNEIDSRRPYFPKIKSHSQGIIATRVEEYPSKDWNSRSIEYVLGRYGSIREKEWKKTLVCKLFEEKRYNNHDDKDVSDTGEGMDSLWEAYEMQSSSTETKKKDKDNKSKSRIKEFVTEQDDEEDEEEDDEGKLCCLQALKFSSGKMNMGVGRRNLEKFSKAVKGFGWLHHVSRTHRKKVVHNGDSL